MTFPAPAAPIRSLGRLDQHALGRHCRGPVDAVIRRPDDADLAAQHLASPRASDWIHTPCRAIAGDDDVVLGRCPAQRRIGARR